MKAELDWRGRLGAGGMLLAVVALAGGCATYGSVHLDSVPPEAEVIDVSNEMMVGTTPCTLTRQGAAREPELMSLRFRKPGYADKFVGCTVRFKYSSRRSAEQNAERLQVEMERSEKP